MRAALTTLGADLATASVAVASDDPTFVPQLGLDPRSPPRRFRSASGLEVDVITRHRKRADEERAAVMPGLQCSAQPLRYLEFLIADPISAVALYGPGVQVTVPQPARFAVHKLIVAQVRTEASVKRGKDLAQAKELIAALGAADPRSVEDAIANARRRGAKWKTHLDRSLREIGLDL